MSDAVQHQSLREDIAFIRNLVEEGRKTPYRGEVSLAAGLIWGSASLYTWAVLAKLMPATVNPGWAWAAAAVVFALIGFPLKLYLTTPKTNRVAATVWSAVGLGCWTIAAATALAVWRTGDVLIFAIIPTMIMALYGAGWMVGSVAFRAPWQRWIGGLCLLSGLALAATAGQPLQYLLFALSLYALAGLPGLIAVLRPQSHA
jgi:hypothetical protein